MKTKITMTAIAIALATFCAIAAHGETTEKQKAAAAFNKGIALFQKGELDPAVKKFREADALNPSWKIKYNIGQCEAALKRYGLAIEAFEQYLAGGGDDVPMDRRDEVLTELDRLRRMVGTISIHAEPGVDIFVDLINMGNTSNRSSVKVTAGIEHQVTLIKDGKKIATINVVVSGGEMVVVPTDSGTPVTVGVSAPGSAATPQPSGPVAAATPTPSPSPTAATPSKTTAAYSNMREVKQALKAGIITRQEYEQHQNRLQKLRRQEYEQLKIDLRTRKITEREYELRLREVKKKFEGD